MDQEKMLQVLIKSSFVMFQDEQIQKDSKAACILTKYVLKNVEII